MSGFGTIQPRNINEIVASIEKQIRDIKADFGRDYTVLSNKLEKCEFDLKKLKEYIEEVHDYTETEYNRLQEQISQFEGQIAELKDNLSHVKYTRSGQETVAVGIAPLKEYSSTSSTYPFSAKYAVNDSNGNNIVETYATKQELSSTSATLSGDYVQKIADSSSAGASALSSVSSQLTNAIDEERQRATSADQELSGTISSVSSTLSTNLENTSSTLQQRIDNEISRATDKENELETAIDNEQTRATNVEEELNTNIDTLGTYVDTQVGLLENSIEDVSTTLTTNLNNEIERATTEESRIASLLDGEITDRTNADTALGERITSEEIARTNADSELQTRIESEEQTRQTNDETLQTNIDNEAQTRETNDSALQDSINAEETARIAAITAEQQARTTAINSLSSEIDENYYTKDEVDEAIANFGGFEVHSTTAEITIPKSNIIYLIGPDTSVTGNDKYAEYIYDNGFILIGETTVDLANYYNKNEINTVTSNLNDAITAETTRATDAENTISQNLVTSATNLENTITSLSGTVNDTIESLSSEIDTQFVEVNNSITDLDSRKQDNLTQAQLSAISSVPGLSQETDYLKVSLEKDGETIYGGMIGNHNINQENAGKILRINTEGTDLELVKSGLTYKIKEIPSLGEQHVSINCDYNTLTNLKVLPGEIIDITVNLPEQTASDIVYHAMLQFTCDNGNQLANVILKYGNKFFNVCKFPESYLDGLVYQIFIYNDCATILPFGDISVKKKDSEQDWILDEYSELLHFFKDMGDEGEIHNACPNDIPILTNSINKITTEPKLGIGFDSSNFGNDIVSIVDTTNLGQSYDSHSFNNEIIGIEYEPKLGIGYDSYSFGNKLLEIEIEPNMGNCIDNYRMGNALVEITDTEEPI